MGSTVTATIVRAGAGDYSDEFTVLDGDGRVLAHPQPPSLGLDDQAAKRSGVSVSEPGGTAGPGPAAISVTAALRYDPAADGSLIPATRARAVAASPRARGPARKRAGRRLLVDRKRDRSADGPSRACVVMPRQHNVSRWSGANEL